MHRFYVGCGVLDVHTTAAFNLRWAFVMGTQEVIRISNHHAHLQRPESGDGLRSEPDRGSSMHKAVVLFILRTTTVVCYEELQYM